MEKTNVLEAFRSEADQALHHKIRDLWKAHSVAEDTRDVEGILRTLAPNCRYEVVNTDMIWEGIPGAAQFYKELLTAIPDARFQLTQIVIGPQGVFEEAILLGTHLANYRSWKATYRAIKSVVGIYFAWDPQYERFAGERIYVDPRAVFE